MATSYSLKALSEQFGLTLKGDGTTLVSGVGTLSGSNGDQISFLSNPAYRKELQQTRAAAVVLAKEEVAHCPVDALVSTNAYADYARIATLFDKRPAQAAGIHPSAVVSSEADLAATASVGPNAVIASGCRIDDGVSIGANTVLEEHVTVGAQSRIGPNVTLCHGVHLGKRVICHPGVVIGADGFGLAFDQGQWLKVPQLGSVVIGDDCEIGANTTVDRGAIEDTVLEEDVRLDNQVQIAHNVRVGAHTAMAGCVGVAGSTRIGRNCMIAGASGIGGHLEITDGVVITAMSMVTRSIREPGEYGSGVEAQPHAQWRKNHVRIRKLDELVKRILRLERNMGKTPNRNKK